MDAIGLFSAAYIHADPPAMRHVRILNEHDSLVQALRDHKGAGTGTSAGGAQTAASLPPSAFFLQVESSHARNLFRRSSRGTLGPIPMNESDPRVFLDEMFPTALVVRCDDG